MKKDIEIKQFADIKVLIPAITSALEKGHDFQLNMIGPIYIDRGETKIKDIYDQQEKREQIFISSDDIFAGNLSLAEFKRRSVDNYFKIVASKCRKQSNSIAKVLNVSLQTVKNLANRTRIELK